MSVTSMNGGIGDGSGKSNRHPAIDAAIRAGKFLLALAMTVLAFGAMNWYLAGCWNEKHGNGARPPHVAPTEFEPSIPNGVSVLVPHEASHILIHSPG